MSGFILGVFFSPVLGFAAPNFPTGPSVPLDRMLEDQIRMVAECDPHDRVELEGESCVFTGYEAKFVELIRSVDDLQPVLDRVIHRDLTRTVVQRIWDTYALAFLSDPRLSEICEGTKGDISRVKSRVRDRLIVDLTMNQPRGGKDPLASLKGCFAGASQDYSRPIGNLGVGNRVEDLIETASRYACGSAVKGKASAFAGCASEDRGDAQGSLERLDRAQDERFLRSAQKLKRIRERRVEVEQGRRIEAGKRLLCPGPWGDCRGFFTRMKECAPDYRRAGCLPPEALNENLSRAWSTYRQLQELEDQILESSPELWVEIPVVLDSGETRTLQAWESLEILGALDGAKTCDYGGKKRDCKEVIRYQRQTALHASRRAKLKVITDQACSHPKEFAQKILLDHPEMVRDFLRKRRHRDMGKMVCMAMKDAQKERDFDDRVDLALGLGTIALGVAAAVPTSGGTLAVMGLVAEGASFGLGSALTVKSVKNSYDRLRDEENLLHGCVGDLARVRQAREEMDDAVFAAQLELGIGAGVFAGLTTLQKIQKFKQLEAHSGGVSLLTPEMRAAESLLDETSVTQLRALEKDFPLRELNLVDSMGKLTPEGVETVKNIQRLEDIGLSRSQIQAFMRSCNR